MGRFGVQDFWEDDARELRTVSAFQGGKTKLIETFALRWCGKAEQSTLVWPSERQRLQALEVPRREFDRLIAREDSLDDVGRI